MYQDITLKLFLLALSQEFEALKFARINIAAPDYSPLCLAISFERLHSGVAGNGGRVSRV